PPYPTPYPVPASYVVPPPPMPMPATRAPHGTWYREVGPMMSVLVVKDGHMSMTMSMSVDVDGETVTSGLVLTADCYLTRDGSGLVGIITGVDMLLEGTLPPDAGPDHMFEELPKLQKALTDQPFALSFRVYDSTLMIGNLRLATGEDEPSGLDEIRMLAGRYKAAGERGVPKPKPMKAKDRTAPKCVPTGATIELVPPPPPPGMPLPSTSGPVYSEAVPTGAQGTAPAVIGHFVTIEGGPVLPPTPVMAPPVPFPQPCNNSFSVGLGMPVGNPRAVDPCYPQRYSPGARVEVIESFGVQVPAAAPGKPQTLSLTDVVALTKVGTGDDVIVNQIRITGSTFTLSVADIQYLKQNGVSDRVILEMQTPPHVPPAPATPIRIHGGIMYTPDSNARMLQLLNESEDLREVGNGWRRFWFQDQPSAPILAPGEIPPELK
ncbi:MAG TPA: hypothetical protein VKE74_31475, partial [Gemmataceae bacterium]|nr:hypothetical protein [Gemmataceae bacterium]